MAFLYKKSAFVFDKEEILMDIRSVTVFSEPNYNPQAVAAFLTAARHAFPVPVQSTRLALPPFPTWWNAKQDTAQQAQALAEQVKSVGFNYASLGPVQLPHSADWLAKIPAIIAATDNLFMTVEISDTAGTIDPGRCQQTAVLVQEISTIYANGFGNLYLAALANCPPGSPYFPVAYHGGGAPHFALALEAADLALQAIEQASTLAEARQNLIATIEATAVSLTPLADELARAHGLRFSGLDFSFAPYPTADKSLAGAMEALGLPYVGAPGSLFAAGFITEAIGRANFRRCGFSGLMLSVLEDSVLAERAGAGLVSVQDLLTYSAVCGVGLDTIPLPGDVSEGALTAVLLDTAMLASRLQKPLTARLMPLPGLRAGDPVTFDFPYFADSAVMPLAKAPLTRLLAQTVATAVQPIHRQTPP